MLKEALERRNERKLPSNFTFRMMDQVFVEAQKQRKRRALLSSILLLTASLFLICLAVYALVFRMGISWKDFMPQVDIMSSLSIISFYVYIGGLVLALLGLDYILRSARKKREL